MIDTHTHLYLEQFKDDIDDVISRAKNVGVHRFYLPSISSKYNKSMHDLEKKFPDDIYGFHILINVDFKLVLVDSLSTRD